MDWIIWLVVIVAIVAIVWWLLNRNSARSKSGSGAAGTGTAGTHDDTPPHLHDAGHDASHRGAVSGGGPAATGAATLPAAAAGPAAERSGAATSPAAAASPAAENPEWETQWSETPPAEPHAALHQEPGHGAAHGEHVMEAPAAGAAAAASAPVHHPEYTEPHAPTLPGAESAAAEAVLDAENGQGRTAAAATQPMPGSPLAEADTRQTATSAAASETAASHTAEPAGHLAVEQPYGEGSAAPAPDGSGPDGFTVKGNASSMVYHDETSPAFEETRAEVWFLSPAHAEAAGFRPPRRTRQ